MYVINNINGNSSKPILIGISSYTFSCGFNKIPSVFTRVSEYLDWIEEQNSIDWPDLKPYPGYVKDDFITFNRRSSI